MTEPGTQPVRRAKHLIDPANPRPRPRGEERRRDEASLNRVRQWVMSVLVVTTMFHLSVGLSIAAYFTDHDRTDARVGLNVIAAIILVAGLAGARLIHKKQPVSAWLLLGVVPAAVGLYLSLR
ncbi:MAG: hypothetical protein ACJ72E_07975 [Marmoricola sp.]